MDDRSLTPGVWLPLDEVKSRPGAQHENDRISSTFCLTIDYDEPNTHQTQNGYDKGYSLNLANGNNGAETSSQKNEDKTEPSIKPTADNHKINLNIVKDTNISPEQQNQHLYDADSSVTKNNKQCFLTVPRQNDYGLHENFVNKNPKQVRRNSEFPQGLLIVPTVYNKRRSSHDGVSNLHISTRFNQMRRSISWGKHFDSTDKLNETWTAKTRSITRLNTRLLEAIEYYNNEDVESLLQSGANPNATCRVSHISACHAAAYYDNSSALHLLIKFEAVKNRKDKFGRTPLHLAAWAGTNLNIAMLLNFPMDLQYKVVLSMTPEVEKEIKELQHQFTSVIDVPCDLSMISTIPQSWKDSIEHKCRKFMNPLPKFFSGWTPLHISSYAGLYNATRLLLVAGANPNCKDAMGQTPLDIAGAACYLDFTRMNVDEYVNTIKSLIEFGGKLNVTETTFNSNSALHTAVELGSVEAIQELLAAGAPVCHQNEKGNTPLHECVVKFYEKPLKVLANHQSQGQSVCSVGVVDRNGYTILHSAIMASWIPGVCLALDAGAVATCEVYDGKTAIHIAALKGDLDILDEILLNAAQYKNAVNYDNGRTEPPIFCAIRSGNLECVQALIDAGALLKLAYYVEPTLGETNMKSYLRSIQPENLNTLNMILHATAEAGNVEILELLFDHNKSLENLLSYKCPYLMSMLPVEFAAYYNRLSTFRYLLQKTLERVHTLQETFDHSRLLHIIAARNHEDMFHELINQLPYAVRTANGTLSGYYPLHDAARNCNRNMIKHLISNGADLSETDEYKATAISVVMDKISKPTEFLANIFDDYIITKNCKTDSDSEVTVDYRALRPTSANTENNGEMRVLTALLDTANREIQRELLGHPLIESFLYLKWKTLSTFFYIIVLFYCLLALSVSVFSVSVFYYSDKHNKTESEYPRIPPVWTPNIWKYIIYVILGIVVIQELSCTYLPNKSVWISKEFWIKLSSYSLVIVLPQVVSVESVVTEISPGYVDKQRYLATVTLIMTWSNIMIVLSKTPILGYHMQMFLIVSIKIIKILITFSFLIFMFSICFVVLFHAREPFQGPWASFVKTLVMMTSEFDYSDIFSRDKTKNLTTSIHLLRILFVIFLIVIAIVLMNVTTGVAVNDVQYLLQYGNLKRLDKQVSFLNHLELSRRIKSIFHFLSLHRWIICKEVPQIVTIKPVNDYECCFSSNIKEAIVNKAQEQLNKLERELESNKAEAKLEKMAQSIQDIELSVLHLKTDLKLSLQQVQDLLDKTTSGQQTCGQSHSKT